MWGVSAEVQTAAIDYASVLAFGLPFFGVAVAFENALRVTSHTRMALISKLSTLFLNTVLNYLLIYGFWKIPALGIFGAGIATSAALFIECIIAAFFSFKLARIMRFSLASFVNFEKKIWTQTMKGVLPILPQEILWSGAVLVYSRAFAAFGTSVLANYNIARQIELFSESGCWAFMVSAGIVIGNDLGAGRLNRARIKAKAILSFGFFFSLLVSLLVWLLLPVSVWAYGLNPESYQLIRNFALLFLLITPLKMMALIILVGILRSGGDFLFSALSEISSMWLYSVPLALFCSLYAGFSPEIVFAVVCSEWFIKAFLLWWRYRKGLWLKNLVEAG
jgi:putative MATE family efflux protein